MQVNTHTRSMQRPDLVKHIDHPAVIGREGNVEGDDMEAQAGQTEIEN
jgi:hypothetical protein